MLAEPPPDELRDDESNEAHPTVHDVRQHHDAAADELSRLPTPATPSGLVEGKRWAHWGPMIADRRINEDAIKLVARLSGQPRGDVVESFRHLACVPRYLLLGELSDNELTAAVYWGIDLLLTREVVIKIHRDRRQHSARALRESQAMARCDHPNVVQIYDMGEHGSWPYSVIEHCNFDFRCWHSGLGWADILKHLIEAAHGLAYLHQNGFAYGDIKPTNILIRGCAKLADFGHATRPRARSAFIADMTDFCGGGTPGYVAPEVARRGPGFAGDVFALAVTTYVCLFGDLPFPLPPGGERTVAATAEQVEKYPPKDPAKVPAGLLASVLPLLKRALAPDPDQRPSLDEFTRGLQAAVNRDERRRRLRRRLPMVVTVVFTLVAVGFSIGVVSFGSSAPGSLLAAGLRAFDPLTRAEIAAEMGDEETAIAEISRAFPTVRTMSTAELEHTADRVARIAKILEPHSPSHAKDAWWFAEGFRRFSDIEGR